VGRSFFYDEKGGSHLFKAPGKCFWIEKSVDGDVFFRKKRKINGKKV
jgi:hypothetical protein